MAYNTNLIGAGDIYNSATDKIQSGGAPIQTKAGGQSQAEANYWDNYFNSGAMLQEDAGAANFNNEKLNQITPQQLSNFSSYQDAKSTSLFDKIAPSLFLAAMSAGIAAPVGASIGASIGGLGGSIAGGAASGALGAGITGTFNGNLSAKGVLEGALTGGVGGGLSYGLGSNGLGLNSNIAKPLGGAASGALSGALNGQGALAGATQGAIRGAVSAGAGDISSGLNNATGATGLGSAFINAGTGMAVGSLASSLFSPSSSGTTRTGANYLGSGLSGQGNMASTDSTLASTITGALPGLLQSGATIGGSVAAGNALSNANQNSITTQQNNLGNIQGIWSNQQATGQGANTALQSSLGLNGQTANPSNFLNMPGYQFAVSQGTQAVQRQAAAMGNAYTPNTAAAIGQYVTGTASQDYNTYISQLMGAAGLGTTANQGLQTANQNTANNISQNQMNIGAAQAGEYTGVAGAASGLFSPNGAGTGILGNIFGNGSSPMNYGGANPNGTVGNGTSSDPYGANASQYNMTNTGNTGVDPSTGQTWGSEGVTTPTFDSNNVPMPSMPGISTTDTNFGGSIDYTGDGSGAIDLGDAGNFLGGL